LVALLLLAVDNWKILETTTVQAIIKGAEDGNAAALEFKRWWDLGLTAGYGAMADTAAKEINSYLKKVDAKCKGGSVLAHLSQSPSLSAQGESSLMRRNCN